MPPRVNFWLWFNKNQVEVKLGSQPDADSFTGFQKVPVAKTVFPKLKIFNYSQHEDETLDEFYDRVINESDPFGQQIMQI